MGTACCHHFAGVSRHGSLPWQNCKECGCGERVDSSCAEERSRYMIPFEEGDTCARRRVDQANNKSLSPAGLYLGLVISTAMQISPGHRPGADVGAGVSGRIEAVNLFDFALCVFCVVLGGGVCRGAGNVDQILKPPQLGARWARSRGENDAEETSICLPAQLGSNKTSSRGISTSELAGSAK